MEETGPYALEARQLKRRFGCRLALDAVDLDVRAGQIHALLGPNGAGKTTLVRVVCGLVAPDGGSVSTSGAVGLVPSGDRTFYQRISGRENLLFFARLQGLRTRAARRTVDRVLDDVGLSEAARLPVGRYSHGMQKRLSVARALLVEPSVLLVDEATHDLDPEGARRIRALISALVDRGVAVVWTTQRIEEIRGFADAVTFLRHGSVLFRGSVGELAAHAPTLRHVVTVRSAAPDGPLTAELLQDVVGTAAIVTSGCGGPGEFLLSPMPGNALGGAIAALTGKGLDVLACRPESGEIEEAFLVLAGKDAA